MKQKFQKLLDQKGIRYWECRKEKLTTNSVIAWNKQIQDIVSGVKEGYSIRVLFNNSWGFVYSEKDNLEQTIRKAVKIARILSKDQKEKTEIAGHKAIKDKRQTRYRINPVDVSLEEKKELCLKNTKRNIKEELVKSCRAVYHDFTTNKSYENSEGSQISQELIKTYYAITVNAGKGQKLESAAERSGSSSGFEMTKKSASMNRKAIDKARLLLKAKTPRGGLFPVICDGTLTDVFIHEALGHASEADHVLNNDSCLAGKMNTMVGNDFVNVYDDARGNLWGSYFYDDEGIPAQKTQIIKNGKLINLLTSRENSTKLSLSPTGNARAEDASYIPIVRMSNTYLKKGSYSFDDILKGINYGFYLIGSRGGQVNSKNGNFTFSAEYGYLIKKGELSSPLKGVSLSGNTLNILKNIEQISNSYQLGSPGMCGKLGQSVPVIGNCPKIRITKALVGGK